MKKYDAIIVGAGHNGLTNAAFLAKAGLNVLCVEKNEYIGGATVSRFTLTVLTYAVFCARKFFARSNYRNMGFK